MSRAIEIINLLEAVKGKLDQDFLKLIEGWVAENDPIKNWKKWKDEFKKVPSAKGTLYRVIKLDMKTFRNFVSTSKLSTKSELESWTDDKKVVTQFIKGVDGLSVKSPDRLITDILVIFKKNIEASDRLMSFPEVMDLFDDKDSKDLAKTERETLVVAGVLEAKDISQVIHSKSPSVDFTGSTKKEIDRSIEEYLGKVPKKKAGAKPTRAKDTAKEDSDKMQAIKIGLLNTDQFLLKLWKELQPEDKTIYNDTIGPFEKSISSFQNDLVKMINKLKL